MNKPKEYRIYRPKDDFSGNASSWNISFKSNKTYENALVFFTIVPQLKQNDKAGNATFAWKGENTGMTLALESEDLAQILAFFHGLIPECKIYHETEGGAKIKSLHLVFDKEGKGIYLNCYFKSSEGSGKLNQTIKPPDEIILKTMLTKALEHSFNWEPYMIS